MKKYSFLIAVIVVLAAANVFFGSANIPFSDVVRVLSGGESGETVRFIILQNRLPQAATALLTGASLAVAGLLLQTAFHNPLAGPSVFGISGGASLGAAVVTLCGLTGVFSVVAAAFAGAICITFLLLFLSSLLRNNIVLLITGLLLGYLISAVITVMNVWSASEGLRSFVVWGTGDFSSVDVSRLPFFAFALLFLMLLAALTVKPMNILQLGDDYAANLGVNISALRNVLLLVVGGITAVTTAFCGPVSFIGLAVPHVARMYSHSGDFRRLMPVTLLFGAIAALLCNLLCFVFPGQTLPVNAVTPVIGVPVIVYILICKRY